MSNKLTRLAALLGLASAVVRFIHDVQEFRKSRHQHNDNLRADRSDDLYVTPHDLTNDKRA